MEVMQKYYWLAVDIDEYELPLAVCDTAKELGEIYGVGEHTVMDAVSKHKSGKISGRRYVRVRREE